MAPARTFMRNATVCERAGIVLIKNADLRACILFLGKSHAFPRCTSSFEMSHFAARLGRLVALSQGRTRWERNKKQAYESLSSHPGNR